MDQLQISQSERDRILKMECYRLVDAIARRSYSTKLLSVAVRSLGNLVEYKDRTPIFTKKASTSKNNVSSKKLKQ